VPAKNVFMTSHARVIVGWQELSADRQHGLFVVPHRYAATLAGNSPADSQVDVAVTQNVAAVPLPAPRSCRDYRQHAVAPMSNDPHIAAGYRKVGQGILNKDN
jgi:hypothetical protein